MSQPVSSPALASIPLDVPRPVRTTEQKPAVCVPRHVAVVPGGTLDASWIAALSDSIDVCLSDGVANLSILVWEGRDTDVGAELLADWVRANGARLTLRGVNLQSLGQVDARTTEFFTALREAPRPAGSESLCVHLAANYNGRAELAGAVQALSREAVSGRLDPNGITIDQLKNCLSSRALPPVDLLIRTDGHTQLSDFLLWQTAYAELLFLDSAWSTMRAANFRQALADYARRRRTFGGLL